MSHRKILILKNLLSEIEHNISFNETSNVLVSRSDIGWHLDHTLVVINRVCTILEKTHSKKYKKDFNLLRAILFPLGYIPRGRARAPKIVDSAETITTDNLSVQLKKAKAHIVNLASVETSAYFIHHAFGTLSKKQTIRFLEIHTKHHLKIVKDILNRQIKK